MCAAAISFMRIAHLYYAAQDVKGGAVLNGVRFYDAPTCHHKPLVESGILEEEASALFTALGDYADCAEQIKACDYLLAKGLLGQRGKIHRELGSFRPPKL